MPREKPRRRVKSDQETGRRRLTATGATTSRSVRAGAVRNPRGARGQGASDRFREDQGLWPIRQARTTASRA